nr:MAG TPA: hypothetical protein [Caudoviricetes sp.]
MISYILYQPASILISPIIINLNLLHQSIITASCVLFPISHFHQSTITNYFITNYFITNYFIINYISYINPPLLEI